MPSYICSFERPAGTRWFFTWSTVVDAPTSYAQSLEDYREDYLIHYGKAGMADLPARIERAIAKGTSSMIDDSLESLVKGNRAGDDEEELALDEIIEAVLAFPSPAAKEEA